MPHIREFTRPNNGLKIWINLDHIRLIAPTAQAGNYSIIYGDTDDSFVTVEIPDIETLIYEMKYPPEVE